MLMLLLLLRTRPQDNLNLYRNLIQPLSTKTSTVMTIAKIFDISLVESEPSDDSNQQGSNLKPILLSTPVTSTTHSKTGVAILETVAEVERDDDSDGEATDNTGRQNPRLLESKGNQSRYVVFCFLK